MQQSPSQRALSSVFGDDDGNETPERSASQSALDSVFGPEADAAEPSSVHPRDVGFLGVRSRLAIATGDTLEEQQEILRRTEGEGARLERAIGGRLYYSPNHGLDWGPVEPVQGEAFSRIFDENRDMRAPGLAIGEMGMDVGEFLASEAGPLVLESALAATGLGGRAVGAGSSLIRRAGRQALLSSGATGAGEAAEQGLQYVMGTQRQTPQEVGAQTALGSLFGGAGGAGGEYLASGLGAISRGGVLRASDEAQAGERALEALSDGRVGLMPQQATRSQIVTAVTGAASKVFDRINSYVDDQRLVVTGALEDARSAADPSAARDALDRAYNDTLSGYARDIQTLRNVPEDVSWEQAGEALQAGRDAYEEYSGQLVNEMYQQARSLGDVRFDASEIGQALDQIEQTYFGSVPQRPRMDLDASAVSGTPSFQSRPDWAPATSTLSDSERSALTSLIRGIRDIDWERAGIEDVRQVQSALYRLSVENPQGATLPAIVARRLKSSLRDVANNPIGSVGADGSLGPVPEGFTDAWNSASRAAAQRFEMLERPSIAALARSDDPYALARQYTQSSSASGIRYIRQALLDGGERGQASWERFRDGFKNALAENIARLPEELERYGGMNRNEALDLLLTPNEREAVEFAAERVSRLRNTGISDLVRVERYNQAFVDEIVSGRPSSSRVDDTLQLLRDSARGGDWQTTPQGRAMRGAVINRVIRDSIEPAAGRDVARVNPNKLRRSLDVVRTQGLDQFLTQGDREMLQNVEDVVPILERASADMGSSLAGRSEALGPFNNPISGTLGLIPYNTISNLVTSPTFQAFVAGRGRGVSPRTEETMRYLGRLADDLAVSSEDEASLARYLTGAPGRPSERIEEYISTSRAF